MNDNLALPKHILASRKGVLESEYDAYGELAPMAWRCGCGAFTVLEFLDEEEEHYIRRPQSELDAWLAKHTNCTTVCYHCRKVEVERVGYWCDACEEASYY